MDVGMMTFLSALTIGLIGMALLRSGHADELSRLYKHKRKMAEKNQEDTEEDIFVQQKTGYLATLLALAGLESKYDQMKSTWIMCSVGGGLLIGVFMAFSVPELAIVGFILGLPLGAAGFVFYLSQVAKRRQERMTEQLPQVLETMVSALRAGSPVLECFKVIADTSPDPIRGEFKRGLISLQLGKPFRDTLKEMCHRIKAPDFALLTQAVFISQEVGGNLADVVSVIAEAIRERFKLRDFLAALTSQGKATAMFIGCLPYGITLITYCATPGYIIPFLNHPIARIILLLLVLWEAIGFWILVKMTTFEV
ncbi:MAG: type II secretion system F family protein [Candidatus Obscuribacterales bacterium]|nr:type II secretion system F family protein [Candidatus Obscuribacterales bacterium]